MLLLEVDARKSAAALELVARLRVGDSVYCAALADEGVEVLTLFDVAQEVAFAKAVQLDAGDDAYQSVGGEDLNIQRGVVLFHAAGPVVHLVDDLNGATLLALVEVVDRDGCPVIHVVFLWWWFWWSM